MVKADLGQADWGGQIGQTEERAAIWGGCWEPCYEAVIHSLCFDELTAR